ncbi:nucleotidyltransferase family protein [Natrinema halophilum]|uniref:nucleotidyltransferase family protein n=1 Tax=Natrinema halophilum TaxID=1699371 RepID=UPI001F3CDDDF|nr:nucleotidyltransferase family protein [Natrinema halophilum]UHQ96153.1 nucleotidyltransferase family protein [Natrinema halophilum]
MTREDLPVVDPPPVDEIERDGSVHGVVLAAGTSDRYGSKNKLLETIDGTPLIRHAVATLVESSAAPVTVVLGYDRERVRRVLSEYDVDYQYNESYENGQSTSVRTGISAARERDSDAVVFALGDMPAVSPTTVDLLVSAYQSGCGSVLTAGYDGTRGNPVLFDSRHFDSLGSVSGDVGGRTVLRNASDAAIVETGDPGVLRDVDRPGDRERMDSGPK